MNRFVRTPLACLLILAAAAFSPALRGETLTTNTLESQQSYLESALAEALRTKDWQMLEMTLSGLKATGLKGEAIQAAVTRAERQAALDLLFQQELRAQVEVWGLASRAQLGDDKALSTLRAMGKEKPAAVAAPDAKLWKEKPAEAQALQRAQAEYIRKLYARDQALLCLAQMKEPQIMPLAVEALHAPTPVASTYQPNVLTLAALSADPQQGWKVLVESCATESAAFPIERQIALFASLTSIVAPPQYAPPDAPFKVDADIVARVPKDGADALWKVVAALAKRWKPDTDPNLSGPNSLVNAAGRLPVTPSSVEAFKALDELKPRLTGPMGTYCKSAIDRLLGQHNVPAAPPKKEDF